MYNKKVDMKVKLIRYTPNPEALVTSSAKLCYSPVGVDEISKDLTDSNIQRFLNMLISMGHESPLEHISFSFAIEGVSRSLTHQLVRHRIASYCVSGDTEVYTDLANRNVKVRTIKDLYEMPKQYLEMTHIRGINENTKELISNKVEEVIYSGKKEVFEVTTELGYKIKTTKEHRFLTNNGWKRLKDITEEDMVYVNGEIAYHLGNVVKVMRLDKIISIESKGIEDTYDLVMKSPHHNFIGNGFVVHNSQQSQRYVKENQFEYIVPKRVKYSQKATEIFIKSMEEDQKSYDKIVDILIKEECYNYLVNELKIFNPDLTYEEALKVVKNREEGKTLLNKYEKMAIENARYVLPNATETKIITTMNARSLLNFFSLRCCNRAQDEINELAHKMLAECKKVAPIIFKNAGPECVRTKCPEGKMSCGNPYSKESI